jgi:hypothetical protein
VRAEDYPRVHPYPIDPEGMSPHYLSDAHLRGLPFDPTQSPLLFHVLTTVTAGPEGTEQLLDLIEDGGVLLPFAERESEGYRRWRQGEKASLLFGRDIAAGDDRYIFTTPCHPFSGRDDTFRPAVIFDAKTVARNIPIAFRPVDLEGAYRVLEPQDFDSDYAMENIPEDEWAAMSEAEQQRAAEQAAAESIQEALEVVVECGTQTDPDAAFALIELYWQTLTLENTTTRPASSQSVHRAVRKLRPPCELLVDADDADDFVEAAYAMGVQPNDLSEALHAIDQAWTRAFLNFHGFPRSLFHRQRDLRPEVLVEGPLPLSEALFYRDSGQRWMPIPDEVREAGRETRRRHGGLGIITR